MSHRPVFVYGTLMPGHPNHTSCLGGRIAGHTPAVADGVGLYRSSSLPYAAPTDGRRTYGFLIELRGDSYLATIRVLDQLEGYQPAAVADSHYVRTLRTVQFADSDRLAQQQAWIYLAGPRIDIPTLQPIFSGRWANS